MMIIRVITLQIIYLRYDKTDGKKRKQFESCLVRQKDTNLELPDDECFRKEGLGKVSECDLKIVGTSGGAVVYPESTTGKRKIGIEPQVCWHYADVVGVRKKNFEDMLLDHPEWTATSAGV
jgi:hypothetical protein